MTLGLQGKVAMVAGASRGLGFAVARALAREGVQVSMSSRSPEAIASAAAEIQKQTGAAVLATPAGLRSARDIAAWQGATLDRFGGIDLLYPNAGGAARRAARSPVRPEPPALFHLFRAAPRREARHLAHRVFLKKFGPNRSRKGV